MNQSYSDILKYIYKAKRYDSHNLAILRVLLWIHWQMKFCPCIMFFAFSLETSTRHSTKASYGIVGTIRHTFPQSSVDPPTILKIYSIAVSYKKDIRVVLNRVFLDMEPPLFAGRGIFLTELCFLSIRYNCQKLFIRKFSVYWIELRIITQDCLFNAYCTVINEGPAIEVLIVCNAPIWATEFTPLNQTTPEGIAVHAGSNSHRSENSGSKLLDYRCTPLHKPPMKEEPEVVRKLETWRSIVKNKSDRYIFCN